MPLRLPTYPPSPLTPHCRSSLHGNPHSEAGWGEARGGAADAARLATLAACNADPERYCVVFTSGATGAAARGCSSLAALPPGCC